mmetsp:Transcript_30526/g.64468  ORF Transcript_30526/g.64468 Transcript_30526/m.64468 type:complete len:188 (-) Transcript_30526:520-1083(-)
MHHLSTEGRRIRCLAELRRIVRVGGLINVQAWALEQETDSRRKFHGTDVLVPFNAQPKYLQAVAKDDEVGNDKSQSVPSSTDGTKGKGVAQMMAEQYNGAEFDSKKNLVVFQRYCHMYRKGELEQLCERVPGLEVMESCTTERARTFGMAMLPYKSRAPLVEMVVHCASYPPPLCSPLTWSIATSPP